jgi:hypothetical protein
MPVRDLYSSDLWSDIQNLLKEEDEHVCLLPMTTFIKPVRVITLVQTETTVTTGATLCPPNSVDVEPCRDLDLDLTTGTADWRLVSRPDGSGLTLGPAPVVQAHHLWPATLPGAQWLGSISDTAPAGDYVFELAFCLCSAFSNPEGEFAVRVDEYAEIYLNGQQIGSVPSHTWEVTSPPTVVRFAEHAKLLHAGENILQVKVINPPLDVTNNPVGLLVAGRLKVERGGCVE